MKAAESSESACSAIVDELRSLVSAHEQSPLAPAELYHRLRFASAGAADLLLRDGGASAASLSGDELRGLLAARGLPVSGTKEELRKRLQNAPSSAKPPASPPPGAASSSVPLSSLGMSLEAELRRVERSHEGVGPQTGLFCDGGCSPNPGPGGWGVVEVRDASVVWRARGADPATTNNRMELQALIVALRRVREGEAAVVYSDSNLCVRTLNEWAAGWEKSGWRRQGGKLAVENVDLVREAYELKQTRPHVEVRWLKGHDGSTWNEYADALAGLWQR